MTGRLISKIASTQTSRLSLIVLLVVVAVYGGLITSPLIWDSKTVVLQDSSIDSLANIPGFFAESSNAPAEYSSGVKGERLGYYRPLLKASLALQKSFFGAHPAGYHLVNILLHAAASLLFFLVLLNIFRDKVVAFVAALLFVVNPAKIEAVAWVYNQSNLFMAVFLLGSFYMLTEQRKALSCALFVCALFVREEAVFFPAVIGFYFILVNKSPMKRLVPDLLPYAAATALFLFVRFSIVPMGGSLSSGGFELADRLNLIVYAFAKYIQLSLWPDAPVAHYLLRDARLGPVTLLLSYALIVAVLVSSVYFWRKRQDIPLFWVLWFFSLLALTLFVGIGGQYLLGEKSLYLAAGGFSALLSFYFSGSRAGLVVLCLLFTFHAGICLYRVQFWQDEAEHIEKVLEHSPGYTMARYTLGTEYARRNEFGKARFHLEKVLEEVPRNSLAMNNLGMIAAQEGDLETAEKYWLQVSLLDQRHVNAVLNLAVLYEKKQEYSKAVSYYREYLKRSGAGNSDVLNRIRKLEGTAAPSRSH